jgi:L-alanine-DL-glutamate epimerase-like enolase superfamily enzyme
MVEPFEIATGAKTAVHNVLVTVRLADGTRGYGEAAPPAAGRDDQGRILRTIKGQRRPIIGKDVSALRPLLEGIEMRLAPGPARAGLEMAVADAWARRNRVPLRLLFGGAQDRVESDVTITIVPPERARQAALKIVRMGVKTIKVKVGKNVEDDLERIRAIASVAPRQTLILDANCGYSPRESLRLLAALKRHGIAPILFEQPAAEDDWEGLAEVWRKGKVPVAADESVCSRADALKMAKKRSAQVVNIKLMKCGLLEAWDIALICRAAGLGLMIGGMVESRLAMSCSAHLAAGLGGFSFIDLDTPLWFSKEPVKGLTIGRGGVYDLSKVSAGIGVVPSKSVRLLSSITP